MNNIPFRVFDADEHARLHDLTGIMKQAYEAMVKAANGDEYIVLAALQEATGWNGRADLPDGQPAKLMVLYDKDMPLPSTALNNDKTRLPLNSPIHTFRQAFKLVKAMELATNLYQPNTAMSAKKMPLDEGDLIQVVRDVTGIDVRLHSPIVARKAVGIEQFRHETKKTNGDKPVTSGTISR